jgi:hypothetical protein
MEYSSDTSEVRIEGVGIWEIVNDNPLQIVHVGCDSSVRLEFCGLLGLADDRTYLKPCLKS